jgi:hypothetical protein
VCRPVVPEPQTTAFEDERHARLRALSRSVGTADGVPAGSERKREAIAFTSCHFNRKVPPGSLRFWRRAEVRQFYCEIRQLKRDRTRCPFQI